jgi:hypothetical protein
MPWWQRLANWTSLALIGMAMTLVLVAGLRRAMDRRRPAGGGAGESASGTPAPARSDFAGAKILR